MIFANTPISELINVSYMSLFLIIKSKFIESIKHNIFFHGEQCYNLELYRKLKKTNKKNSCQSFNILLQEKKIYRYANY
ncbi:hypothetical protein BpHYR1_031921 [Brachionus plicatilis]|uniref:Uncharacterized protein n=1 Tax=Brachionus plicatilis TaxID=10195 RepID=A0A3M7SI62_BRAPC|nr:hypothetical protein BpHYR1_031921 [Brachionus plicatilis]